MRSGKLKDEDFLRSNYKNSKISKVEGIKTNLLTMRTRFSMEVSLTSKEATGNLDFLIKEEGITKTRE